MKKIPVINQIIKDKRKEMKITQQDFTKLINKAISTIRRYDTGDIIPENTLILICDKLGLYIQDLLQEQKRENIKYNQDFYSDIIDKKLGKEQLNSTNEISENMVVYIQTYLKKIYSILYDDFYFEDLPKAKDFKILFWDNKIIVKKIYMGDDNREKEKLIDILKINEAENLITDTIENFNNNLFLIRNKKNKKIEMHNVFHELVHLLNIK